MTVKKMSISVDERTEALARELVEKGRYRNLSHLFEEGAKLVFAEEGVNW